MKSLIATLILMPLVADAANLHEIAPEPYRGRWQSDVSKCDSSYDATTVFIGERYIEMWEAAGPIVAVVAGLGGESVFIAELSGSGETWLWSEHYVLSENGNELRALGSSTEFSLHRCVGA